MQESGASYKTWEEIGSVVSTVLEDAPIVKQRATKNHPSIEYYNLPCSFDIETTSFRTDEGEKAATMYEWTLCLDGQVVIGRTWEEYTATMRTVAEMMGLGATRRLVIYVHNLEFEFQFMRGWFEWDKVFAIDTRRPVYAITTDGVEYRCSYILSGYSLAKLGEMLTTSNARKMVGDLDYELPRHSHTPLTEQEIGYCVNDVLVVCDYIRETIANNKGSILKIPLTKTGYVRRYVREKCFGKKYGWGYRSTMRELTMEPEEYRALKRAFQGGFTHASAMHVGKTLEDVTSYDITSSYPTVMVSERYPMSKGMRVTVHSREEFEQYLDLYCCVFDATFYDLEPKNWTDNPLSYSRCWESEEVKTNNGRVVTARKVSTTITDVDFAIYRKMYRWSNLQVGEMIIYRRGYLPTPFVRAVLDLYRDKTTLKGVEGKEVEYQSAKEMVNSCYGMCVTDIVRVNNEYKDGEWVETAPDLEEAIDKYNNDPQRFLAYAWGVWITAYARRNLFGAVIECGGDYVYSDTDSCKTLNADKHRPWFEKYNNAITARIQRALAYHRFPADDAAPKTIKGVAKPLGVWDFDGEYSRFKTLGAKRYLVEYKDSGTIALTVSGLNKKKAAKYLVDYYGREEVFAVGFNDRLHVPGEHTGKLTHTYIDTELKGELVDYLGNKAPYHEKSAIHLEPASYDASVSSDFVQFYTKIQNGGVW